VVTERDAYDAWGKRRDASSWADDSACLLTSTTTRGYTGHEELDSLCLVNMNARIYEPTIGRFMSADSVVPDPLDLQTFNRYSYVSNNPLSFTDPSGHCSGVIPCGFAVLAFSALVEPFAQGILRDAPLLGDIFVIASGQACGPLGAGCAAVAAAGVEAERGGSAGQVLRAYVITLNEAEAFELVHFAKLDLGFPASYGAYSPGQLIASAGAHGLVGGLASVAGGGSFKSGFMAASFSDAAGGDGSGSGPSLQGAVIHSVVGGLASVLGGGKFANGAVTGAFGYLFNAALGSNGAATCTAALGSAAMGCGLLIGTAAACPETGVSCLGMPAAAAMCAAGATVSVALCSVANSNAANQSAAVVHGNSLRSLRATWVYELRSNVDDSLLKYGITSDTPPEQRYTTMEMLEADAHMVRLEQFDTRLLARVNEFTLCTSFLSVNGRLPPMSARC
jgi:RHS repeat-associated protein